MPLGEKGIEKTYYSIGEVAKIFDVNASLIRFWEKQFDILKPYKNKKGTRYYTKEDIETFRAIYHLVKERKYTLEGAKEKLAVKSSQSDKNIEIYKSLVKLKQFLLELKEEI